MNSSRYNKEKDPAVRFHLKQSLGVMILGILLAAEAKLNFI